MKHRPHRLAFALTELYGGRGAAYGLALGRSIRHDRRTQLLPACRLPAAWPSDSGAVFERRA
jgi:hypothetical protein